MNDENFFSIDRLVEFGLGIGVAQQMVKSMNHALQNTYLPGTMNPMNSMEGGVRPAAAFFVILDGKQAGPFSEGELTRLIAQGSVTRRATSGKPACRTGRAARTFPKCCAWSHSARPHSIPSPER